MGNHKLPIFSVENYDNWSRRMKAHLCSIHENMLEVIEEGPITIMIDNEAHIVNVNQLARILNPTHLLTSEEKKVKNLEFVAQAALFQTLDEDLMKDTKSYRTAKKIWDLLADLCKDFEAIKETKLELVVDRYESFKMHSEETISSLKMRFLGIISEMNNLGRTYPNSEMNSKILENLIKEWDMKVIATKKSRDLNSITLRELFGSLKAREYECPELPEDKKAKVKRNFFKRKAMMTNTENAVLDDSDYPSGIDSDGYSFEDEVLFYLMGDNEEEVSTCDSLTFFYHIHETSISSNEINKQLRMLEDWLAAISSMHLQLKEENDDLRDEVKRLRSDHDRTESLEAQSVECETLKLKILSHQRVETGSPGLGYNRYTGTEKGKTVIQTNQEGTLLGFKRSSRSSQLKGSVQPSVQQRKPSQRRPHAQSRQFAYQQRPPTQQRHPTYQQRSSVQPRPPAHQIHLIEIGHQFKREVLSQPIFEDIHQFTPSDFATQFSEYLDSRNKPRENSNYNWFAMWPYRKSNRAHEVERNWPQRRARQAQDQRVMIEVFYPTNSRRRYKSDDSTQRKRAEKREKGILSKKRTKEVWYLDNGCSKHMIEDKEDLEGYKEVKGPLVTFGDNSRSRTIGEGSVVKGNVVVNRVSHVEGLKHKLLSISQLGYTIDFSRSSCSTEVSWLWHRRLNHLNFRTINHLAKKDLVDGLPKEIFKKTGVCGPCQKGKQVRSSFKNRSHPPGTTAPLQLLHMDLFGLVRPPTPKGKRFTLVVVDDFSRYTWVEFLKSKDEIYTKLSAMIKRLQTEKEKSVQRIHSDNGMEFIRYSSSCLQIHMMSFRTDAKTEVRRSRYKVAVDADEGWRRMEDNMVEI
ncbi:importin alpha isoform 2 [Perilla frutescens var. frutescens]|nr:importin alpha isoform 2 [Perilla frutescens var. frutescens]